MTTALFKAYNTLVSDQLVLHLFFPQNLANSKFVWWLCTGISTGLYSTTAHNLVVSKNFTRDVDNVDMVALDFVLAVYLNTWNITCAWTVCVRHQHDLQNKSKSLPTHYVVLVPACPCACSCCCSHTMTGLSSDNMDGGSTCEHKQLRCVRQVYHGAKCRYSTACYE